MVGQSAYIGSGNTEFLADFRIRAVAEVVSDVVNPFQPLGFGCLLESELTGFALDCPFAHIQYRGGIGEWSLWDKVG